MNTIKTGVVGVGYLGNFHAEKYATLAQSELIAVCDTDVARGQEIAQKYNTTFYADYEGIADLIDAVSIVAPTPLHHKIGKFFLERGVHVLMEKPIATTVKAADDLIETAKNNNAILQVGHLERFNKTLQAIRPALLNPLFIESTRFAPFKLRGTDVNVVLDVMIHDIDLIQSIVDSKICDIRANGASVLSPFIDIANARLEFENGCVANVTASRVSLSIQRRLRIFQHDCYIGVDLDKKEVSIHRKGTQEMLPGIPEITSEQLTLDNGDALKDQIEDFLNCIIEGRKPLVTGQEGKHALETAITITKIMRQQLETLALTEKNAAKLQPTSPLNYE